MSYRAQKYIRTGSLGELCKQKREALGVFERFKRQKEGEWGSKESNKRNREKDKRIDNV